jgi:hypothetical protein
MSSEPHHLSLRDLSYWQSRRTHKSAPGRRPTLGDLQRSTPWVWMHCERCQHSAPFACAVAVIRWGAERSSDKLRQCARCTGCGSKGATIQHPGWGGNSIGFLPFPVDAETG